MRSITFCAAMLCLAIAAGSASAQTPPPSGTPSGTPSATDKAAISKACSDQANAKGLHGKPRKAFRAACKKRGGAPL